MRDFDLLPTSFDSSVDRFFNDFWKPLHEAAPTRTFKLACDIEETDSHFLLSLDVPGVDRKDIKIEVVQGELRISGQRKLQRHAKDKGWTFAERGEGHFLRSFRLGEGVDAENVEAKYENGVLYVALAKTQPSRAREVHIADANAPENKQGGFLSKLLRGHEETNEKVNKA